MASYHKRGDTWTARFRFTENNEVINKALGGFKTKKEAQAAYEKFMLLKHTRPLTNLSMLELFDLFKDYKKTRIKESSYMAFCQTIRDYIMPYFSRVKVKDISKQDVLNWQAKIDVLGKSFRTKDKAYTTFVNLMNYAVEFYDLPMNVVSKVGNFKNHEQKKKIIFWTDSEFEKFISVVDNVVYKAFFSLLYLTGARKGEAMALSWKDVNLGEATIDINKTYTNKTVSGGYQLTTTKTKSSTRVIVIPDILVKILRELKAHYEKAEGFSEDCFVFGLSRPLPLIDIDRKRTKYCEKAGVKKIKIHDFRHSHASLLINKGQNILLVSQRLGHSDVNMTLNTYSHLFPNKQRELMNSLNINIAFETK